MFSWKISISFIFADDNVLSNLSSEQICSRTATNWENCDEKDIGSPLFIQGGPPPYLDRYGLPHMSVIFILSMLWSLISKSTNSSKYLFFYRHILVGINLGLCGHIPSGQMPEMYTSLLYLDVNTWVRINSSPYRDKSFCSDISSENPPEGGAVSI